MVVATFEDLPVCGSKRDGATAYVKDEKVAYVCENKNWVEDGLDKKSSSSSKAKVSSSSGSKSKSSSSGSKSVSSSSSKKKSSSSSGGKQVSSAQESSPVEVVKEVSVSGVSQKGPFVTGAAVKLYELNAKTYAQTGKSFVGKIVSDDGKFSLLNVTLSSQYALLEANGYFRNEITGKKSNGTILLNALTDLSDRKNVNINLLTHLEYERALYLIGTGLKVSAAKKQAEKEIFSAFGIQGDFANSEDLDIFSKGEGNAALLAFSVMMLRNLGEADFTEFLTKFATDVEKDGKWDDEKAKAQVADWAMSMDLAWGAGDLSSIRANIEKWDLGTVPDFEKYVRHFWYVNYGLDDCNTEGEVVKNQNSKSEFKDSHFLCKDKD